jgi:hypothetical protein
MKRLSQEFFLRLSGIARLWLWFVRPNSLAASINLIAFKVAEFQNASIRFLIAGLWEP